MPTSTADDRKPTGTVGRIHAKSQFDSWTSTLAAVIIEHMFGETTAFKHFGCGGAIHRRHWPHRTIFKCAKCWEWSEDLLDLVKDPKLKEPAPDQDSRMAVPDFSTD